MYGYGLMLDGYFWVLIVPAMLFSLAMQFLVKSAYTRQSKIPNARHLTGEEAARRVLAFYEIQDVRIEHVHGRLSDHYDPRTKTIRLSDGVFGSSSVAAVGIAAHEAGHAAQHAKHYVPIRLRNSILPICNLGSTLGMPLVILGIFVNFGFLTTLGLVLFALSCLFHLVTLPVEFNASRRALHVIDQQGLLEGSDYHGAKKVLQAAALTYVAALILSVANLLRLFLRTRRRQ